MVLDAVNAEKGIVVRVKRAPNVLNKKVSDLKRYQMQPKCYKYIGLGGIARHKRWKSMKIETVPSARVEIAS